MGAYIAISEISLQKSKIMNNAHTVYASLIDFFGDTKRDLSNFVDFMEDFNIFNFNNCGKYSGVYRGKHFTFDDGYVDTSKLLNAIDAIDRYNKHYNDDVKLMVHESYILEKDIVNFSLDANLSEDIAKTVVRLYIKELKTLVDENSLGSLVEFKYSNEIKYPLASSYRRGQIMIYKSNMYQKRLNMKQRQKGSSNMNSVGSLVKVNKTKARSLYEKGAVIMLLPCKLALNNIYIQPIQISNKSGSNFDSIINEFEYYNCSSESGSYASYYVDSSCITK